MSTNLLDSKTAANLMKAFAGECQAMNRYKMVSDTANKQQMYFIHQIFKYTSHQEQQHAKIYWDLLKPCNGKNIDISATYPVENVTDLIALLKSSVHNETEEGDNIYPSFAKIAKEEGFQDIATKFEEIAAIEKTHAERFQAFAELLESGKLFNGESDTVWICLNCGHIYTGATPPKECPVCNHPQGYSVPYKYYKFCAGNYTSSSFC